MTVTARPECFRVSNQTKGTIMKKLMAFVVVLMIAAPAVAADDLVNCKWENGMPMTETICEDQRYLHGSEEDRARIDKQRDQRQEAVRKRAGVKKTVERELTKQEKSIIVKAVAEELKDPDSAKFKWVKANILWGSDLSVYCGLLNGKNSYGAYIGYRPFYVKADFVKGRIKKVIEVDISEEAKNTCMMSLYSDLSSAK